MAEILTSPVAAFIIYLALGGAIMGAGRLLAGPEHASPEKSAVYASGEAPPGAHAIPSYRGFVVAALFFAVLHLGVLVAGGQPPSVATAIYIGGLLITLLAMLLG